MNQSARLIRNSSVRMANFMLGIGISFFMMPFLIRNLGDRMYGLWTLVGSVLGYYGLIDVGLSSAVVRFMSRAVGQENRTEVKQVFCTAFYLFLALGLVTMGLTGLLATFLKAIVTDPADLRLFQALLIILGLNFAFDFPVRAFNAVFTSTIREDLSVGITIVKTIVNTVFVVAAINHGYGVMGLAVVSVCFSLVDSAVRVVMAYKLAPDISVNPVYFDRAKIKPLFNYSAYTFVGRIADIFRFRLDHLIITSYIGLTAVTHFFVAGRLVDYLKESLYQLVRGFSPVFSQDEGRNDYEGIRRKFLFLSKLSLYCAFFFVGVCLLYGNRFIQTWMGPEYRDAYPVLVALVLGFAFPLMQLPVTPLLYGISKHKYYTYSNFIEGIMNLFLSIWLVQDYGILGVAIGTAVPMAFMAIFVQPWYVCRAISLDLRTYVSNIAIHASIAAVFLGLGYALVQGQVQSSYGVLALCGLVQALIYWPCIAFAGFTADERSYFGKMFLQAIPFTNKAFPQYAEVPK